MITIIFQKYLKKQRGWARRSTGSILKNKRYSCFSICKGKSNCIFFCVQIPGKKESTKKNQKIKPKKKDTKSVESNTWKKDTKIRKMPSKNKVHISKDSPNAGTGGSLVLYSYKEKHERHRKNIIKKEVRKSKKHLIGWKVFL